MKYRENKLIVTKVVQNVRHWHKHKHTSVFVIGQLRHQSATTPSRVTHAVDAVAVHRCHELWSHTHVAEWQTIAPDMWPPNLPDLNSVDYAIWSVIQFNATGNILRVHYKGMKCDVSFSLGIVSTLFRWGGHFCHVYIKHFSWLQQCKNYQNRSRFSRAMITNVLPPFYGSQCISLQLAVTDIRQNRKQQ